MLFELEQPSYKLWTTVSACPIWQQRTTDLTKDAKKRGITEKQEWPYLLQSIVRQKESIQVPGYHQALQKSEEQD